MDTQHSQDPTALDDDPAAALPEDAPDEVKHAARGNGAELTDEQEVNALDYLLGRTVRPEYDSRVEIDTEAGRASVIFHLQAQDERTIQRIDSEHRAGEGPFAELDKAAHDAALVAESTLYISDVGGRRVEVNSEEFVGAAPNVQVAMEVRFKYQPGLLSTLAEQVRRISGYSADRVGGATRALRDAAGG